MGSTQIVLGDTWEAVGPFPSGMREHPLVGSPISAYLDSSIDPDVDFALRPFNEKETWPSEIGNKGKVGWQKFVTGKDGWLDISYPEIKWDQLRSDHGWASLQYQSILRNTITIPQVSPEDQSKTAIQIDVIQGVEYAFIPSSSSSSSVKDIQSPIEWYTGDIYAFAETPTGTKDLLNKISNFARSISLVPGEYIILVRAMYEIRMFGDPGPGIPPVIKLKIVAESDNFDEVEVIEGLGEIPDVINGWFMGGWFSTAMRVSANSKNVEVIGVESSFCKLVHLSIPKTANISSGQIRPISVKVKQIGPLPECTKSINIKLKVKIGDKEKEITWHPTFKHILTSEEDPISPFKITFASPSVQFGIPASVSHAMIVPPPNPQSKSNTEGNLPPVLLALHGAGVDITEPEYIDAVPSIPDYWTVLPTGRNEWGEDWHGSSMQDVWAARDILGQILNKIGIHVSDQTILMGHSNGGQGAWHSAARYPDRIVGMVTASGWLTIQDYVPYTELTSRHFADPALMGILSSSLTPYNNDLYLSNLVGIPILVVHGDKDDNVPVRHSRTYHSILSSWAGKQNDNNVKYVEIPEKGHWWDDIIRSEEVIEFIQNIPEKKSWDEQRKEGFTLTTANPQESGGRAGIRIIELDIPGKLARLDVNARQWKDTKDPAIPLDLRGTNIKRIELKSRLTPEEDHTKQLFPRTNYGDQWIENYLSLPLPGPITPPRAYGPLIRILSSTHPITIISPNSTRTLNIAKRIAHDLYVYQRLDSEIIDDQEGLLRVASETLGVGNLVIIGRPEDNLFSDWMIKQSTLPLKFPTKGVMLLKDKVIYDRGAGIITLYPHPLSSTALAILIAGNDDLGLDLAARLFPIRTGVPIPDWAIIGPQARWKGAGGFIGAGFWNGEWDWSSSMSWTDR
ncbi:uncharacterized protein L201_004255 [Kwoniella dendrophila CBS 6074]|uniref:Peptidase S9 prolyl oligopeptidase catalytic domain-containing protein n=1 Tax=Kwoniella dendrophila CBS 6074 TaxID=1295534 RepID=A0AAX4JX06_9TREE